MNAQQKTGGELREGTSWFRDPMTTTELCARMSFSSLPRLILNYPENLRSIWEKRIQYQLSQP